VAAAFLVVGGWVLLRWQQGRQQFAITKALIERGVTRLPDGPPFWLISLRNGMNVLVVGIGLVAVGSGAWMLGSRVVMPSIAAAANVGPDRGPLDNRPEPRMDEPPGPPDGPPEDWRPPRGDRPQRPQRGDASMRPPGRAPAGPNPALERWHRAQAEESIGMVATGCGVILCLLGIFRIAFAFIERKHIVTPSG